ncbi:isopentenyl phosphate kinase [Acidianus manzaensis]|uniref:Isopentenyl phosphate kinase n=1 Tax=Acidianus manzaensis TaxID=282676 RepID=A0A1W6JZJ1_9CREN|nr:isopentenyl phosphate kinase [Acidianus manzaensis]ARM75751.1 hypothetical protein B6F84_06685 [Acidianus manzaensis]
MGLKMGHTYSILKLGGSLITDKSKPYYLRENVVRRIAKELITDNLILIHGGGSFGHYEASKGNIIKTSLAMQKLNLLVSSILYEEGIKIFPFPGRFFSIQKTLEYVKSGYVPLIYGDIDENGNIISGDDIAVILAKELKSMALFATDVDGVINNNMILDEVNSLNFEVFNSNSYDVTGGIKSKIKKILEKCIEGIIFNGLKEGNINKVLKGEQIGTLVRCKNDF